jgi:putative PIN family toxin of toxin-antitoxin system
LPARYRLVLDTNVLVRGLIDIRSHSGRIVDACDRRAVVLLLSRPVLAEYRSVLTDAAIAKRYPQLTAEKVEVAIRRLRYVGDELRTIRVNFEYGRDPKDEAFIELAIAGNAIHIVTLDKDLLALKPGRSEAAKSFRR